MWRLLETGEEIKAGDEVWKPEKLAWEPTESLSGVLACPAWNPIRRNIVSLTEDEIGFMEMMVMRQWTGPLGAFREGFLAGCDYARRKKT